MVGPSNQSKLNQKRTSNQENLQNASMKIDIPVALEDISKKLIHDQIIKTLGDNQPKLAEKVSLFVDEFYDKQKRYICSQTSQLLIDNDIIKLNDFKLSEWPLNEIVDLTKWNQTNVCKDIEIICQKALQYKSDIVFDVATNSISTSTGKFNNAYFQELIGDGAIDLGKYIRNNDKYTKEIFSELLKSNVLNEAKRCNTMIYALAESSIIDGKFHNDLFNDSLKLGIINDTYCLSYQKIFSQILTAICDKNNVALNYLSSKRETSFEIARFFSIGLGNENGLNEFMSFFNISSHDKLVDCIKKTMSYIKQKNETLQQHFIRGQKEEIKKVVSHLKSIRDTLEYLSKEHPHNGDVLKIKEGYDDILKCAELTNKNTRGRIQGMTSWLEGLDEAISKDRKIGPQAFERLQAKMIGCVTESYLTYAHSIGGPGKILVDFPFYFRSDLSGNFLKGDGDIVEITPDAMTFYETKSSLGSAIKAFDEKAQGNKICEIIATLGSKKYIIEFPIFGNKHVNTTDLHKKIYDSLRSSLPNSTDERINKLADDSCKIAIITQRSLHQAIADAYYHEIEKKLQR